MATATGRSRRGSTIASSKATRSFQVQEARVGAVKRLLNGQEASPFGIGSQEDSANKRARTAGSTDGRVPFSCYRCGDQFFSDDEVVHGCLREFRQTAEANHPVVAHGPASMLLATPLKQASSESPPESSSETVRETEPANTEGEIKTESRSIKQGSRRDCRAAGRPRTLAQARAWAQARAHGGIQPAEMADDKPVPIECLGRTKVSQQPGSEPTARLKAWPAPTRKAAVPMVVAPTSGRSRRASTANNSKATQSAHAQRVGSRDEGPNSSHVWTAAKAQANTGFAGVPSSSSSHGSNGSGLGAVGATRAAPAVGQPQGATMTKADPMDAASGAASKAGPSNKRRGSRSAGLSTDPEKSEDGLTLLNWSVSPVKRGNCCRCKVLTCGVSHSCRHEWAAETWPNSLGPKPNVRAPVIGAGGPCALLARGVLPVQVRPGRHCLSLRFRCHSAKD